MGRNDESTLFFDGYFSRNVNALKTMMRVRNQKIQQLVWKMVAKIAGHNVTTNKENATTAASMVYAAKKV